MEVIYTGRYQTSDMIVNAAIAEDVDGGGKDNAADGGDGWSFDGKPPKRTFGIEAMAGRAKDDYKLEGLSWTEILKGNYDKLGFLG